jgi:hypothetical protein
MFKKNPQNNEQLDRLGKLVLCAAAADEQEIEQASTAAFVFTRIRARIAEEQRQNENVGWQWLPNIAWRAVPVMALVASITGGLMLWAGQSSNTASAPVGFGMYEDAMSDTANPGVEQTVLSRNNLSREEIFTIVVDRSEREQK